jgi:hypothetical protein
MIRDLTGHRFGRLVVIRRFDEIKWVCLCVCGAEKTVRRESLVSGGTQSCGCLQRERTSKARRTHGYTSGPIRAPEYKIWSAMKRRCYNANDTAFSRYGGRGVTVCDRWRIGEKGQSGFACFIADMGDRPSARHMSSTRAFACGFPMHARRQVCHITPCNGACIRDGQAREP